MECRDGGYNQELGVITCYNGINLNRNYATVLQAQPAAVREVDSTMNIYILAEAVKRVMAEWKAENGDVNNADYTTRFPVQRVAELFQVYADLTDEAQNSNKTLPRSLCHMVSSVLDRAKQHLDVLVRVNVNPEFKNWLVIVHELLQNSDYRGMCPTRPVVEFAFKREYDTWF
jgi:hypothetical protein